jgi:hypothetical protein
MPLFDFFILFFFNPPQLCQYCHSAIQFYTIRTAPISRIQRRQPHPATATHPPPRRPHSPRAARARAPAPPVPDAPPPCPARARPGARRPRWCGRARAGRARKRHCGDGGSQFHGIELAPLERGDRGGSNGVRNVGLG